MLYSSLLGPIYTPLAFLEHDRHTIPMQNTVPRVCNDLVSLGITATVRGGPSSPDLYEISHAQYEGSSKQLTEEDRTHGDCLEGKVRD